jgi:hypothetical protein
MISGGNWWRANEIVMSHLIRQAETRYDFRDNTGSTTAQRTRISRFDDANGLCSAFEV